jgi:hypothetical protein
MHCQRLSVQKIVNFMQKAFTSIKKISLKAIAAREKQMIRNEIFCQIIFNKSKQIIEVSFNLIRSHRRP